MDVVLWKKSHRSDVSAMSGIEEEQPARVGFVEVYLGEEDEGTWEWNEHYFYKGKWEWNEH